MVEQTKEKGWSPIDTWTAIVVCLACLYLGAHLLWALYKAWPVATATMCAFFVGGTLGFCVAAALVVGRED